SELPGGAVAERGDRADVDEGLAVAAEGEGHLPGGGEATRRLAVEGAREPGVYEGRKIGADARRRRWRPVHQVEAELSQGASVKRQLAGERDVHHDGERPQI